MSSNERRYTAKEWRDIQEKYLEQPRRGVRAMFPDPFTEFDPEPFTPESSVHRANHRPEQPRQAPHVESWMATLSAEDITKLEMLIALRPETVKWVSEKNSRELEKLDGAVEFITSSRTAAKVLMYVSGVAVAFVGGAVALAKSGYDAFALIRGVGK